MSIVTLSSDLQNADNAVPQWIQLLPDTNEFTAIDGREFIIKDANEIITLSTRKNVELHIDYEHSIRDKSKELKPAAGWIKELAIKNNAIWGDVEWTPKATQMITNKEYRYLSPLLSTVPTIDGKHMISKIVNVALTNHPALEMSAFCSNHQVDEFQEFQDLSAMSEIAEMLDMQSCKPNDILTALKQKQISEELQSCKADVDQAFNKFVFPRSVEDEFTTLRQVLGKDAFQALTQKLSFLGLGVQNLRTTQTQALKARGIDLDNMSGTHGLSAEEIEICNKTNVNPIKYLKAKEVRK